jgi:tetratricopeptide (TPR) repeat protein
MGRVIGDRFELIEAVGAGGAGDVFSAVDLNSGVKVAIKELQRSGDQARFIRECSLLASLDIPSVVRYVAHGTAPKPWLAMEWVEGCTLSEFLRHHKLSPLESLKLVELLSYAVGELHLRGIIHRDIKPGNIILQNAEPLRPVLIDLGLARTAGPSLTQHGSLLGTVGYMAPEQARGSTDIDCRVDVFALGCLLFRCIAGAPPFTGEDALATILRISLEHAPRLRSVCKAVDAGVDQLCARLLSRDRDARPTNAGEVATLIGQLFKALERTELVELNDERSNNTAERRFSFLVLVTHEKRELEVPKALEAALGRLGLQVQPLIDGSLIVVVIAELAADDLAQRAARASLYIRYWLPESRTTITMGRMAQGGAMTLGEKADQTSSLVSHLNSEERAGVIGVDHPTARLLADRFVLRPRPWGALLITQHAGASLGAGDMTGEFVGRTIELQTLLEGCLKAAQCSQSATFMLAGASGGGKSRLARELLGALDHSSRTALSPSFDVWILQGDPLAASTPFSMLVPLLYVQAGIGRTEKGSLARGKLEAFVNSTVPASESRRVTEFLVELLHLDAGPTVSPAVAAARRDTTLMGDQVRRAVTDLLRGAASSRPLLMFVEDLQWGDAATLALLHHAVKTLNDITLVVVGLTRPEGEAPFLHAFKRSATVLRLPNLDPVAASQLALNLLGTRASSELVTSIVERAEGNPFFLEELVRASVDGSREVLPPTIISVVEGRLERLSPECRRIVRAASAFGETFWESGLASVLGRSEIRPELVEIEGEGIIRRSARSRYPMVEEWSFRQRLLAEVSYDGLSQREKELTHAAIANWLESVGEGDPTLLAGHLACAGDHTAAGRLYAVAAHLALEASDLPRAIQLVQKAIGAGAFGEDLGRLLSDEAEAQLWLGDNPRALTAANQAISHLELGSTSWCRAATIAVTAGARTNERRNVDEIFATIEALEAAPGKPLEAERLILLAQAAIQAVFLGDLRLTDRLLSGTPSGLAHKEPLTAAWLLRARAWRALAAGDPAAYGTLMRHSASAFDEIGDRRNACVQQVNEAYSSIRLGQWEEAIIELTKVIAETAQLGIDAVAAVAEHNLGYALLQIGDLAAAERAESRAIEAFDRQGDRRMLAASLAYQALILSRQRRFDEARQHAEQALLTAPANSPTEAISLSIVASVILDTAEHDAAGREPDGSSTLTRALSAGQKAASLLNGFLGVDEGELFIRTVLVRATEAVGDIEAARELCLALSTRLSQAAALLPRKHRGTFLTRVPEARLAQELCERLGAPLP